MEILHKFLNNTQKREVILTTPQLLSVQRYQSMKTVFAMSEQLREKEWYPLSIKGENLNSIKTLSHLPKLHYSHILAMLVRRKKNMKKMYISYSNNKRNVN